MRTRAVDALEALGPSTAGLTASRRAEVADYLLGQQGDAEADETREYLAGSAAARAWARSVSAELRPLGGTDLPEIPDQARRDRRRHRRRTAASRCARTGPGARRASAASCCSPAWP